MTDLTTQLKYGRIPLGARCHASHGTGCAVTTVPVSVAFAGSVL